MTRLNRCDGCKKAPQIESINDVLDDCVPFFSETIELLTVTYFGLKQCIDNLESCDLIPSHVAEVDQSGAAIDEKISTFIPSLQKVTQDITDAVDMLNGIGCVVQDEDTCPRELFAKAVLPTLLDQSADYMASIKA